MKKWFLRTSLAKLVLLFGCPIIIFFNFLLLTLSTPDQDNLSLFTTSAPSLRSPPVLTEGPPALVPPKDVPGAFISIHDSSQCLDTMGHNRASQKAGMFACHYKGGTQSWTWSSKYGTLRNEMMNLCLCKELILCDCEKNIWPIQEVAPHVLFGLSYVPKLNRNPMSKYDFDERVSAAIGPYRASYPDLRHKTCKNQKRANLRAPMLTTTIIICFVDEEYNTLLRTIYSVLTRSPSNLLDEIILVDDGSTDPRLLNELPIYIERHLPRVRLVRTHARTGLIRARVRGVSEASSPTVTFLDSHVEVGDGWLSPLMERLSDSSRPRLIVCPVITVINQNTLKPQTTLDHGNTAYGVFDWKLIFHWKYHRKDPAPSIRGSPPKSPSDPVESPTMAGGLFSMRVQDFYDMGTYDEGMEGWGGENLELSFRAWMCGGSIEIVPCSLVGHIFRKKNPTKFETGSVSDLFRKNLKRVAEVWMDDYKDLFYTRNRRAKSEMNYGDVSKRVQLRNRLKCQSFQWYMDTLVPNMFQAFERNIRASGALMKSSDGSCFQFSTGKNKEKVSTAKCLGSKEQKWYYTNDNQIRGQEWPYSRLCLTSQDKVKACSKSDSSQRWIRRDGNSFKSQSGQILNAHMNMRAKPRGGDGFRRVYESLKGLDCDENMNGSDIEWPSFLHEAKSLEDCKRSCDSTSSCESFSFGIGISDCWLKRRSRDMITRISPRDCEGKSGYVTYVATSSLSLSSSSSSSSIISSNADPKNRLHGELPTIELVSQPTPGNHKHGFNEAISATISLDRDVLVKRHRDCDALRYDLKSLPDTTVIFVFVNEAESVLYRSIHSVLNRTPPRLLKEIILVDDGSDAPHLQEPLERAVNALPKVRLIRLGKRSGLVKARLAGARAATSRTITILDSHIEVQHGWLEPLMNRIRQDSHHVVMPIIDGMDGSTFEASKYGKIEVLGFLWSMVEHGIRTQKIHEDQRSSKHTDPEPSPTMAGGLFSMDREYFFRLGGYDEEFGFWGAENLEISFRIWQCGGTIEVMPCSRVYHIFRKGGKPYKTNTGDVVKNKLRTAAIWMDDYAKYAYDLIGKNPDTFDVGPLDKMKELRKSLNCKSFSWYLENVYPENSVRILERARKRGALRSKKTNRCLDDMGQKRNMGKPEFYPCHNSGGSQSWMFTERNEIRPGRDWDRCLDGTADKQSAFIYDCHGLGGNQKWQLRSDGSVKHVQTGRCLVDSGGKITFGSCDDVEALARFE